VPVGRGAGDSDSVADRGPVTAGRAARAQIAALVADWETAPRGTENLYLPGRGGHAAARHRFEVEPGHVADLDTYFNGFPVAYWRRHTSVREVRLRGRLSGAGLLRVVGRTTRGATREVAACAVQADGGVQVVDLPLLLRPDDEWWWVELAAGTTGLALDDGGWWADVPEPSAGVAITTFDRPDDCAAVLRALAAEPGPVARVVVVDQGRPHVRDHEDFPVLAAAWGDRLLVVEQPNLGGSGGFARGAVELMADERLTHVVLLDDDVVVEPEAVRRLVSFGAAAGEAVIGGQMLELIRPTVLHSTGEAVHRRRFFWGPAAGAAAQLAVDGRASTLRALTRVTDVDFNGWWMCALPTSTLRRLGLPLPLFIKWDDVEYGLRARRAGVPTVTLPGAAVWHMPWTAKDASRDWQAFFLARNRLVVAALERDVVPWGLLAHLGAEALSHLVTMAYSVADLVVHGLEEFRAGPSRLVPTMIGGRGRWRSGGRASSTASPPRVRARPRPSRHRREAGSCSCSGRSADSCGHCWDGPRPRASRWCWTWRTPAGPCWSASTWRGSAIRAEGPAPSAAATSVRPDGSRGGCSPRRCALPCRGAG